MSAPLSFRIRFAPPSPDGRETIARVLAMAGPNESIRKAFSLGLQKLAFRAQKERFTGQGPFPVAQNRLGVVSGRLRRDLHAEAAVLTDTGVSGRIGAAVEYFGAHEVGFSGTVNVPAHTRKAYTVKRKERTRTSKSGKPFSIRANQYSVLPASVRAHSKRMNIPARKPLRTAIEEHGGKIIGTEIRNAIQKETLA
jgi:hypothetical protein